MHKKFNDTMEKSLSAEKSCSREEKENNFLNLRYQQLFTVYWLPIMILQ